jgi:hypothetical protein
LSDALGGDALGTAYLLLLIEAYRLLVVRPTRETQSKPALDVSQGEAGRREAATSLSSISDRSAGPG